MQTLSKWVKQMLSAAGIDISRFKPHLLRHASSSAVFRQGFSVESICRTAGWSEKTTTFVQFYNRPLSDKTDFARPILEGKLFFVCLFLVLEQILARIVIVFCCHPCRKGLFCTYNTWLLSIKLSWFFLQFICSKLGDLCFKHLRVVNRTIYSD